MKLAIVGSTTLTKVSLVDFIPEGVTEIVTGGAKGVDTLVKGYAEENSIKLTVIEPKEYIAEVEGAEGNPDIVNYADEVLAFWNGRSKGTKFILDECAKVGKKCNTVLMMQ